MHHTLKALLSLSLFIILVVGVTGYYYQIQSKASTARLSNFSDNNEEDLHNEDFTKRFLLEDFRTECLLEIMPNNILFPHPPDCILEGHSGLVTPPPWC